MRARGWADREPPANPRPPCPRMAPSPPSPATAPHLSSPKMSHPGRPLCLSLGSGDRMCAWNALCINTKPRLQSTQAVAGALTVTARHTECVAHDARGSSRVHRVLGDSGPAQPEPGANAGLPRAARCVWARSAGGCQGQEWDPCPRLCSDWGARGRARPCHRWVLVSAQRMMLAEPVTRGPAVCSPNANASRR